MNLSTDDTILLNKSMAFSDKEISEKIFLLTEFEKKEVWEYCERGVFYIRKPILFYPRSITMDYFTDNKGYYIAKVGDHISYRYEVLRILGRGSFGTVLHVYDHKDQRALAIKVERNFMNKTLKTEYIFLKALARKFPCEEEHILQVYEFSTFRNHSYLVEEILESDLQKKLTFFQQELSPKIAKSLIQSTLRGLCLLCEVDMIHADIKPSNIALNGLNMKNVKVIDFSSAHMLEISRTAGCIQSMYYRAPEVLFKGFYGPAIDMWSLGCVTAELFLGKPLFYGHDEADQLACIIEVLGSPPKEMIQQSTLAQKIFEDDGSINLTIYNRYRSKESPGGRDLFKLFVTYGSLDYIDFVSKCLTWNPNDRLTPHEALKHPWIRRRIFDTNEIILFILVAVTAFVCFLICYF